MRASTATLDATWVSVRRHLLLLANGATTSFEQKVSSGKSESTGPTFRHNELAKMEKAWAGAKNDRAKQRVIDAARETIFYHSPPERRKTLLSSMPQQAQERFRKLAVGQELLQQRMEGTQEFREAVASEEGSLRAVATLYGISHDSVRRYRQEFEAPNGARPPSIEAVRSTRRFIERQVAELISAQSVENTLDKARKVC